MRIPFDSLDSTAWLAFSDYSAELGQEKRAGWCKKVGEALEKFARSGSEVRMVLCHMATDSGGHGPSPIFYLTEDLISGATAESFSKAFPGHTKAGDFHWVTRRKWLKIIKSFCTYLRPEIVALCKESLYSPADLPEPWKQYRLSQKFFASVVSRARGIRLG